MAGMYLNNEEITIYGEKVQWPGVDKNGKFTNGSFSDPHEPPSFIPANTINLILDNLSELITKLGGKPDNSSVTQLANVIKAAAQGDSTDKKPFQGLGLVKTANSLPRMAEAGKNAPWAASPNWVWNLILGNAEQGFREKVIAAMRSHVKSDPHVFCYRGQVDANKLNTATAVGMHRVAYPLHQGALLAFDAPGSVGHIQFLKEDWHSSTRWKYRNAVDNKLNGWNARQTPATMVDTAASNNAISAHINRRDNPHGVTKAQIELGNVDNTADKDKTVKHAASANVADGSNYANQLQAFASDNFTYGEHFIKAIRESEWWMRLYGCYKNDKKEANCVRVAYADDAGTASKAASADSAKNADTVDGFHAGNGAGMLVPVVAVNVGENAGYIKLGNGLIVQWGYTLGDEVDVKLPIPYAKTYSISLSINAHSSSDDWSRMGT